MLRNLDEKNVINKWGLGDSFASLWEIPNIKQIKEKKDLFWLMISETSVAVHLLPLFCSCSKAEHHGKATVTGKEKERDRKGLWLWWLSKTYPQWHIPLNQAPHPTFPNNGIKLWTHHMLFTGDPSYWQKQALAQVKRLEEDYQPSGPWKQAWLAILISDKVDFKLTLITGDKEGHSTLIKGEICQKEITIINLYAPNVSAPNFIKHTLKDQKA
jgi:hypothetical protein